MREKTLRIRWLEAEMQRLNLYANNLEKIHKRQDKIQEYRERVWEHQIEYQLRTGEYYSGVFKQK